jgi:hypothetical protein
MDNVFLVSTLSLIFQIVVFVLLLEGYLLKKQRRFRLHRVFMLLSVALHLVVILALMVPSFVLGVIPLITTHFFDANTILAPIHAATGTAAVVLGVWIVAGWRLRQSIEFCVPKKVDANNSWGLVDCTGGWFSFLFESFLAIAFWLKS